MQTVRVAKSLLPEEARPAIQQCIGGANYTRQVGAAVSLARHEIK